MTRRRDHGHPQRRFHFMQKKTLLESGFFNLRTITGCAFFFAATLLAYFSLATRPLDASAPAWQGKVDPTVLSAAGLAETEFLIYMKQQADLSGSSALTTKEEKGQYVYQQLTATAESTQGNVKQTLTQLGAPFQSFWISNTLWTRGSLAVVQAVAALSEVAAIHPVGKGGVILPPQQNSASSADQSQSPSAPDAISAAEPGLAKVKAPEVWAMGYRGQGVVVAGADTGVRFTHDALKNQYRGWGGTAATSTHDYNWHDAIHIPNWPP